MMMATQIISDLMMVMNMILGGSWWTTLGLFLTAHIYQQNMIATLMLNVLSHWHILVCAIVHHLIYHYYYLYADMPSNTYKRAVI